jgi:hypothetical protein
MGCGCRKRRGSRISRAKAVEKKRMAVRIMESAAHRSNKMEKKKAIEKKLKFCKSCPQSIPNREERRKKIKVCHKANISIQGILNKKNFKCPIGNF